MNDESVSATELVQLPAIKKPSGETHVFPPDINKAPPAQLEKMAELMGGVLYYPKFRAVYTLAETRFCGAKECWRPIPSEADWCDTHHPR